MAEFINKKEEVISISLTQHGKYLFSKGQFKPAYYSFYDDDILYDGSHGGVTSGSQNENLTRIKDSQTLKINPVYEVMDLDQGVNSSGSSCAQKAQNTNNSPVGNADPWSDFAPAWKIQPILDSQGFSGSVSYMTSSLGGTQLIPQIDVEIEYRYDKGSNQDPKTILALEQPRLLLDIQEVNTIFKNNLNFEIEVYEIENQQKFRSGVDDTAELRQLQFAVLGTEEERTALERTMDDPSYYTFARDDAQTQDQYPVLNRKHIEHYMNFRVDGQIADSVLVSEPSPLYVSKQYVPPEDCD